MTKVHSIHPRIGGHVSAAGRLALAFERAEAIGAECMQIFGASPRQWKVAQHSPEAIREFIEAHGKSSVGSVFLHASYLVNLGAKDAASRAKSVASLAAHLKIASDLKADGLIFHVGSANGHDAETAHALAADAMREVVRRVPGKTPLLIENAAGGGSKIGSTLASMADLKRRVKSPRVKFCIDTAHAFEAGILEFTPAGTRKFVDEVDTVLGTTNVLVIHANDSKTAFGSRHDRHENIGEGHIGMKGFRLLAKEKRLWHAAWLMEVPGFTGEGCDAKNILLLKSCFS